MSDAIAELQRQVRQTALKDRVRLLLLTYDPEFDTAVVLRDYAVARGMQPGNDLSLLQLNAADNRKLLDELDAAVNFNGDGVKYARHPAFPVRRARALGADLQDALWNNADVARDLTVLTAEKTD